MVTATIEIDIFSGLPNPAYSVATALAQALVSEVAALTPHPAGFKPTQGYDEPLGRPRAGYRGFVLTLEDANLGLLHRIEVFGDLVLDTNGRVYRDASGTLAMRLFALAPAAIIQDTLAGLTYAQLTTPGSESQIDGIKGVPLQLACEAAPKYDGNTGSFLANQARNNCYNYATHVVNTKPGRAAIPGTPDMPMPITRATLEAALLDDGFSLIGMALPAECPPEDTHYVAIVLRRNPTGHLKDFHCLRLDRTGIWSHKDGKGPVRDVDDSGKVITDLAQARFSWKPDLVGFYLFPHSKRGNIE